MLFWPMTRDTTRLPMAVHHALWAMSNAQTGAPTASKIFAAARPLLDLETRLEQYAAIGKQRIEAACSLLRHASGENCAALQSVREWAESMRAQFASQLEAASTLRIAADNIRPLVLVVDGEAFQRRLLQRLLADIGLESIFATSALEALAIVTKRRPDLIVTSVNLPDLDGMELTRRLKRSEHLTGITVVMITDQGENLVDIDCQEAGAPDFIIGPRDRRVLLAKIRQALSSGSSA
jgi:PleD family two-component response regulator